VDPRAALALTTVFAGSDPEQLDELAAMAEPHELARGQVLFREGDASQDLYVVVTGRLKVHLRSARHREELILAVLGPGDTLGELSLLDGQPRSADARALDESTLLALPAEPLRVLLERSPGLALAVAQEVAATLRRLTGSTGDLVLLDLPRRLAKHLLEAGPGPVVELGLSQTDLAARLGVARQSLNRALSSLQTRGWIRVDGTAVELRNRRALERLAGS
jgi:CRP/FNR family transcriptional regulator